MCVKQCVVPCQPNPWLYYSRTKGAGRLAILSVNLCAEEEDCLYVTFIHTVAFSDNPNLYTG